MTQPPGVSAAENLARETAGYYSGFLPSLEAAYRVGSPVVLAPNTSGPDLQMQRLLRRAGRAGVTPPPVLEINPRHPVIRVTAVLRWRDHDRWPVAANGAGEKTTRLGRVDDPGVGQLQVLAD